MQYSGGLQGSARASWRKRHLRQQRGGKSADRDGKRDDGGDTIHPPSIASARPFAKFREAQLNSRQPCPCQELLNGGGECWVCVSRS